MRKSILLSIISCLLFPIAGLAVKIVHGPYLQNVGSTEATIVWVTDADCDGHVELAPDDGTNFYACARPKYYDTNMGVKRVGKIHAVRLTGLSPNTSYRYRILSTEVLKREGWHVVWGYVAASDVYSRQPLKFTTLDPTKPETSFVILNDIHEHVNTIEPLLKRAGYENSDMVICNGDMVSILPDAEKLFTGFMDESVRLFASEKPFYYVRGNHETRGAAATLFHDYVCPRQEHLYFMWRQGPVCFIALDTGEDKPDDDLEYAGMNTYDSYRDEQAKWLAEAVQRPEYKDAPYHVVICHIPPVTNKGEAWHGNMEVTSKFVPVLNKAGVDVMICAHEHRFSFHPDTEGVNFPIVINANTTSLRGETKGGKLHLSIYDEKGKVIFSHDFGK